MRMSDVLKTEQLLNEISASVFVTVSGIFGPNDKFTDIEFLVS